MWALAPWGVLVAAVVSALPAGTVDWSAGKVAAQVGVAPPLGAPTVDIARASSERNAKRLLIDKMLALVTQVPVLSSGVLGKRLDKLQKRQLLRTLETAVEQHVDYQSDGGVYVKGTMPLAAVEALFEKRRRRARPAAAKPPHDVAGPVDAGSAAAADAGVRDTTGYIFIWQSAEAKPAFVPGIEVRYYDDMSDAKKDERLGASPEVREVDHLGAALEMSADAPVAVVLGKR